VRDLSGQPVAGAAVLLGAEIVFTNDAGEFQLRQRRARVLPVKVELSAFVAPGDWRVVTAPSKAQPGTIEIVVARN
jgi:hypothetical protein